MLLVTTSHLLSMKYQQLENQEAKWKWLYLMRKYHNQENICRYQEKSANQQFTQALVENEHNAEFIENWVKQHLHPDLKVKLDQAIRAKRKRFFNAEHQHTRKKSIDLNFAVWRRLAEYSKKMNMTLSETIIYMIEEQEKKHLYANQVTDMKSSLEALLDHEH